MIQGIYSVKDLKAGAFAPPFFMPRDEAAVRAFSDAVLGGDSLMVRHPEDFVLFRLGDYDDNLGLVAGLEQPLQLYAAAKVVQDHMSRQPPLPMDPPRANGAAGDVAGVTQAMEEANG